MLKLFHLPLLLQLVLHSPVIHFHVCYSLPQLPAVLFLQLAHSPLFQNTNDFLHFLFHNIIFLTESLIVDFLIMPLNSVIACTLLHVNNSLSPLLSNKISGETQVDFCFGYLEGLLCLCPVDPLETAMRVSEDLETPESDCRVLPEHRDVDIHNLRHRHSF